MTHNIAQSIQQLDSKRRFASSFGTATNIWLTYPKTFFLMHGLPCLCAGVVSTAWLITQDWLGLDSQNWQGLVASFIAGLAILFIWTIMRVSQTEFISRLTKAINKTENNSKPVFQNSKASNKNTSQDALATLSLWKRDTKLADTLKKSLNSMLPLGIAWIITFAGIALPALSNIHFAYMIAYALLVIILICPLAGLMQSHIETSDMHLIKSAKKGFCMFWKYGGSYIAMWIIAFAIIAFGALIIYFGELIIDFAFTNQALSIYYEEEIEIPTSVHILKYLVMFTGTIMLSYLTPLCTLPQQIHIRSVICKNKAN